MADQRPSHHTMHTMGPSLMNQPTEPTAARPPRCMATVGQSGRTVTSASLEEAGPAQSIADHIDDALKHVAGLTPRQRLAVHNEMTKLCRDISFIRMISDQALGPWSRAAVQDEGRPLQASGPLGSKCQSAYVYPSVYVHPVARTATHLPLVTAVMK